MSIINDALKKTQQSRKHHKDKRANARISKSQVQAKVIKEKPLIFKRPQMSRAQINYILKVAGLLTITTLLMMILTNQNQLLSFTQRNITSADQTKKTSTTLTNNVIAEEANKMRVVFEGVFMSDHNRVALINKQTMQVGDLLNGMPIIKIDQDRLTVKSDKGYLELKAGATYII